jgi:heat shock protein HslJ
MSSTRMKKALTAAVVGAFALAALAACSGTSAPGASATHSAADVLGTWTSAADPNAFLTFTDDGRVGGKDGCNTLSGGWAAEADGTVTISGLASTMMYCEGVDTWLSKAATVEIAGTTATVADPAGANVGTLQRG